MSNPLSAIQPTTDLTGYFVACDVDDEVLLMLAGSQFGLELTPFIIPVFSSPDKLMGFLVESGAPIPCLVSVIDDEDIFIDTALNCGYLVIIDPTYSEESDTGNPVLKGVVVNNPEVN